MYKRAKGAKNRVMNEVNYNKKIKLSNKIYPLFFGFSGDLLFWIAINTIFLTTVKGFNAAQISSFTTIGNLIAIILYPISIKIIKKNRKYKINKIRYYTIIMFGFIIYFL